MMLLPVRAKLSRTWTGRWKEMISARSPGREHLRQMTHFDLLARAAQAAANLHQASAIVRDHYLRAALPDARHFVREHRRREGRELHREHPAEAAALLAIAQIANFDSRHRAQ